MLRHRLDPELHGSAGFTSVTRIAAVGLVVGFFVLSAHLATKAWYNGRMLPGVVVSGRDVGGLTLEQTRAVIRQDIATYRLRLDVAGEKYELAASEVGVNFDPEATLVSAYAAGRDTWLPPLHHDPIEMSYQISRVQLRRFAVSVAKRVGTPPVDAGVVVAKGVVSAVPEKSGWSIDRVGLERLIEDDVRFTGGASIRLKPREQVADIQAKTLAPTIARAKSLMAVPVVLAYGDKVFTPTPAQIGQWIAFVKQPDGLSFKLVPQVDTAELKDYIQDIAGQLNVAPVNEKITVKNGVREITQKGVEGLAIEQDKVVAAIKDAVTNQKPLAHVITAYPVAFKTVSTTLVTLDYGRYIEVNLSSQRLWVWQDHNVIHESPLTSGAVAAGFGTPTGLFSIYYKTTNTHLRGQGYDVAVKYWMPFHLGYGLHDASWRNGRFGGQDYYSGGSHGCVNLPDATAEFIYNWAAIGTPVWVHR